MILELAQTGKPLVVLLSGGSAVNMENWMDKVPTILQLWYPGEQGSSRRFVRCFTVNTIHLVDCLLRIHAMRGIYRSTIITSKPAEAMIIFLKAGFPFFIWIWFELYHFRLYRATVKAQTI